MQRAKTASTGSLWESSLDPYLSGPDARRAQSSMASHTSWGMLAQPRLLPPRKPRNFWQSEFAQGSHQLMSDSSLHDTSMATLKGGLEHINALRQRQMTDMKRLLEVERKEEIERQAACLAQADRRLRLNMQKKAFEQRERSRAKILRVARDHELALASRMASMGLLR